MRVDLAAEVIMVMPYCTYMYNVCHMWYVLLVLSEMIAKVLESDGHAETAQFVNYFDKFFDCLNVASNNRGQNQKKNKLLSISLWQ